MNTPENDTKRRCGRQQTPRLDDQEKIDVAPAELRLWRAGYRDYLEAKGVPPASAADMAAKVSYRPDLYPTGDSLPLIQAILAAGITVSACLSGAAIVLCRREPEAF